MKKESIGHRFRALSAGAGALQRRPRSEGPLPTDPANLDAFLTAALIQDDPAPLLQLVGQVLREPAQEGRVLYLRDKAPKWSVTENLGRETQHQTRLCRWNAIHKAQQIGRQFLVPPHESWAVQEAAQGLMSLCDAKDTRQYGLTATETLRQHLLVLHMAYVTLHHEPPLPTSGSPKKKKGVAPLLPAFPARVEPPVEDAPVSVSRRMRQPDASRPSSGRSSPTKPRVTVRFKSSDSMGALEVERDEPLRARPGSSTPPYAKRYGSGGSRRTSGDASVPFLPAATPRDRSPALGPPVEKRQALSGETPTADTREH